MQDFYFTCGGTAAAFFVTDQRTASIFITRTDHQTSIIKTPSDSLERLARWRKHTEISKDQFFRIYDAAVSLNAPGKQKWLEFLSPYSVSAPEGTKEF